MSTVSAQSAFWAVVALALNTACQPTGSVLSSPAAHSRALRTSPIICVGDAIVTLSTFVTLVVQRHGVRDSARAVLYWRFHENGVEPEEEAKIEQGWFRTLFFVLGALPQMIKVIGFQGVPWTQALCSIYLASFAVVELPVYLAGKERDDFDHAIVRPDVVEKLAKFFRDFGGVVQAGLWIYLVAEVLIGMIPPSSGSTDAKSVEDRVAILSFPVTALSIGLMELSLFVGGMYIWILVKPLVQLSLDTTSSLPTVVAECLARVATAAGIVWLEYEAISLSAIGTAYPYNIVYPGCWGWSIIIVGILGMFSVLILDVDFHELEPIEQSRLFFMPLNWPGNFEPLFFFLMNAASLLLYYLHLYKPQSTVKPAWTEWLG